MLIIFMLKLELFFTSMQFMHLQLGLSQVYSTFNLFYFWAHYSKPFFHWLLHNLNLVSYHIIQLRIGLLMHGIHSWLVWVVCHTFSHHLVSHYGRTILSSKRVSQILASTIIVQVRCIFIWLIKLRINLIIIWSALEHLLILNILVRVLWRLVLIIFLILQFSFSEINTLFFY